jgi:8-amino-7-oxononanoate synthase
MNWYANELKALKRSGRYRERKIYDSSITDLASNDYLGLAENPELAEAAFKQLQGLPVHAPKASMLVNGYHPVHADFERALCEANGFEAGIIVGSGFNANIAMIEALVRKGDELFIDERYHASGVLASRLVDGNVTFFRHNDAEDLELKLRASNAKRRLIAVEGIYSMDGDCCERSIIELSDRYEALLIMDEAHSSGVIGPNLMGIFDHYAIPIQPHYIKMGTLGKAYGSFGAYILACEHIIDYLVNRAKPVIYATAPSLYDTLLGHEALRYIIANRDTLAIAIRERQLLVESTHGMHVDGLIVPIVINDNQRVMAIRDHLLEEGILVGAIRQPTVEKAIIRLILRSSVDTAVIRRALESIAAI